MSCNSLRDFRLKSLHTLLMFATGRLTHGLPLSIVLIFSQRNLPGGPRSQKSTGR
jgi:hypothetical protein